ncbi:hypothetical protein GBAR_LOCUS15894 [Geodia barretti]|uniref:Uncharacterized protein n=1 Tax=Geodia barretti TaxID=519541 RepID=A0AA35SD65_GEOBA|nr:hypothetical protein GBAR_LOCUS15894 [Geodia barretti]
MSSIPFYAVDTSRRAMGCRRPQTRASPSRKTAFPTDPLVDPSSNPSTSSHPPPPPHTPNSYTPTTPTPPEHSLHFNLSLICTVPDTGTLTSDPRSSAHLNQQSHNRDLAMEALGMFN